MDMHDSSSSLSSFDETQEDKEAGTTGINLSSISLFHLGQQNPSSVMSFGYVSGVADRPPLSFVAGCRAVYILMPQLGQADEQDQCQYAWRPLDLSGMEGSQILGIAVCQTKPDDIWLLVASMRVVAGARKPQLAVIKYDRLALGSDPHVRGNVQTIEALDWCPLTLKTYHDTDQDGFLISGSDGVIHVRMLVRHNVYNSIYDVSTVSIGQIVFLRHLAAIKSPVLSLDYCLTKHFDLWAAGCQDGWLQLWVIPESQEQGSRMTSLLLNGPLSAVTFFTVSPPDKTEKVKKVNEDLAGILRRAEAARPKDDQEESWYTCHNLLVAECVGRVMVFWNVEKYGLTQVEVLPSPPLETSHDILANSANRKSFDRKSEMSPAGTMKLSLSAEGLASNDVSISSSPVRSDTPTKILQPPPPADGGLLGTGALCVHASDATGDGVTELIVGTYAKTMVVYKLIDNSSKGRYRELASPNVYSERSMFGSSIRSDTLSWRYEVASVRCFPYAVHAIHTLEPMLEATKELQILTAYHLHVIGPEVQEVKSRMRSRLALIQQILELEKQCSELGVETGGKIGDRSDAHMQFSDDDTSSGSSSTSSSDDRKRDEIPAWVLERFRLGR